MEANWILRDKTVKMLGKYGVEADPALDEQQLVDADIIFRLIKYGEVGRDDTVLEIGAGCGNITAAMAGIAGKVFAVEKNNKFIPILNERMATMDNVVIIHSDALRIMFPPFDKLVSNLPFSICEAVINRLTRLDFAKASLVVSSSFARTVTAGQGNPSFTRLSLLTGTFLNARYKEDVPLEAYLPPSKSPTSVITLEPRKVDRSRLMVLRGTLLQDQRKLKNALREAIIASSREYGGPETKREAASFIKSMGLNRITLEKRVARLSLSDLLQLREAL
jgi:16S rRNA (adenine1518-N6/adenine1519-N6)-dimethyltransferase